MKRRELFKNMALTLTAYKALENTAQAFESDIEWVKFEPKYDEDVMRVLIKAVVQLQDEVQKLKTGKGMRRA